jgi:hypothetical protein
MQMDNTMTLIESTEAYFDEMKKNCAKSDDTNDDE